MRRIAPGMDLAALACACAVMAGLAAIVLRRFVAVGMGFVMLVEIKNVTATLAGVVHYAKFSCLVQIQHAADMGCAWTQDGASVAPDILEYHAIFLQKVYHAPKVATDMAIAWKGLVYATVTGLERHAAI